MHRHYPPGRDYVVALVLLTAALALRLVLHPYVGPYLTYPTVFVAVLVATLYCGMLPAALIAVLGFAGVEYLLEPELLRDGTPMTRTVVVTLYLAVSVIVIGLTRRFKVEHDALRAAELARRSHEARLYQQANFDALTGLAPTARSFSTGSIRPSARPSSWPHGGAAVCGSNRFKEVNDAYGHPAGDQLLTQIAAALTATVRREDTVARLGGDEFAILLPQIDTHQHAALFAQKVGPAALSRPYPVEGGQATISAAIGVALSSDCAGDAASFVKCADMAMFRCKKNGKGGYELFHSDMAAEAERVRSLQQRLREALARGEFVLHYQPKVSFSTSAMTGCEALLRWQPPAQALVMPGEFIGNLEDSGFIVEVGGWVVREACAQIARWQCEGLDIPVAVNVSAKQISPEFVRTVRAALEEAIIDGSQLQIELTESSVMQRTDEAIHVLNELRAMGLRVAIDDFGTGHASLALLKRLPVDVVKIDARSWPDCRTTTATLPSAAP